MTTTYTDRRGTFSRRAHFASFYLLGVLAAVFCQPGAAVAQWSTSGNNNTTTTNNVVIGTTAPSTSLQIRPAANINMGFTHAGGTDGLITASNDANTATAPLILRATSFKFQDGTQTERFRISSGVAVGSGYVGTAPPANGVIIQGNVGIGATIFNLNLASKTRKRVSHHPRKKNSC